MPEPGSRVPGIRPPANVRTAFLITIDTEGDNLWARPGTITTRNAEFLPRFQRLCEAHGMRPTYLVNYEMAQASAFQEFGRDVVRRAAGEIGMHLHAWNTPPLIPLTADDLAFQPYLIEYAEPVMRQKISRMTDLLEQTFGIKMTSHRAGRWAFNETYARILAERGYLVDCSVTPHVSWRAHLGSPDGNGGPDYSGFPTEPYFVDLDDIARPGNSPLLEVPMTIVPTGRPDIPWLRARVDRVSVTRRLLNRFFPLIHWLRPDRRNARHMLRIVHAAADAGKPHLEFMIHSSELMPGGSPLFPTEADIENLYADLDRLFATGRAACTGTTLSEFHSLTAADRQRSRLAAQVH
jgi:hypothetical protein